jgi:hypothetical protein
MNNHTQIWWQHMLDIDYQYTRNDRIRIVRSYLTRYPDDTRFQAILRDLENEVSNDL